MKGITSFLIKHEFINKPNKKKFKLTFYKLFLKKYGIIKEILLEEFNNYNIISISFENNKLETQIKRNKNGNWNIKKLNEKKVNNNSDRKLKKNSTEESNKDFGNFLFLKGFNKYLLNEVYNLFSCFGNIKDLFKDKITKNVIVNFNSERGMIISSKYFNKYIISKSTNYNINLKLYNRFEIKENIQRLNFKNTMKINYPSKNLFVYNISSQLSDYFLYFNVFNRKMIRKFKIIKKKEKVKSYLFSFYSKKEATYVLMKFHLKLINNQYMKISYSNSKFN